MEKSDHSSKPRIINATFVIATLICLLPMVAGIILWDSLPDTIAYHFTADGTPNRWGPRIIPVYIVPIALAALTMLMCGLFNAQPGFNTALRLACCYCLPLTGAVVGGCYYANIIGHNIDLLLIIMLLMGFIIALIGNYLPKTPVSLINIEVQTADGSYVPEDAAASAKKHATKRAGRFMFVCGIVLIAAALTPWKAGLLYAWCAVFVVGLVVIVSTAGIIKQGE